MNSTNSSSQSSNNSKYIRFDQGYSTITPSADIVI